MLEQLLSARLPIDHPIMWSIGLISLIMWGLIIQCYSRFHVLRRMDLASKIELMLAHYTSISSTQRRYLKQGWTSQIRLHLNTGLSQIHLFVRILPMLGLLGTVDGMMDCFKQLNSDDVLSAVSNGISQAMLTTLAGLLAALSGMYLAYNLKRQQQKLIDHYTHQWKFYEN